MAYTNSVSHSTAFSISDLSSISQSLLSPDRQSWTCELFSIFMSITSVYYCIKATNKCICDHLRVHLLSPRLLTTTNRQYLKISPEKIFSEIPVQVSVIPFSQYMNCFMPTEHCFTIQLPVSTIVPCTSTIPTFCYQSVQFFQAILPP